MKKKTFQKKFFLNILLQTSFSAKIFLSKENILSKENFFFKKVFKIFFVSNSSFKKPKTFLIFVFKTIIFIFKAFFLK